MKQLPCDTAYEWIVKDLDEGLEADKYIVLENHLRLCPDCRRFKEETATLLSVLPENAPQQPDEEFWNRYRSSLHARLQEAALSRRPFWTFGRKLAAVPAALAVILVLVGGPFRTAPQEQWPHTANMQGVVQELREFYGPVADEIAHGAISGDLSSMKVESRVLLSGPELMTWYDLEYETNSYSF